MPDFFPDLAAARGKPSIGGLPVEFVELYGAENIDISFHIPDPLTAHRNYFYDARNNVLYFRKVISENYVIWQPITHT
jgi:hypothetical protein